MKIKFVFFKGKHLIVTKENINSFKALNKAIGLDPNNLEAYNHRGVAYFEKGDYDEAIRDFQKVISIDPRNAFAFYNLGNAYLKKKMVGKSINSYDKAIEYDPARFIFYYNRGNAYLEQKLFDNAITDYVKALELNSNHVESILNLGVCYYNKGDFDEAIRKFDIVTNLDKNNVESYFNRGNAYSQKEAYEESLINYNKAIKLKPESIEPYLNRGTIYYRKGKFRKAIKDFNNIIKIDPYHSIAYYNIGLVYSKSKEFDKALYNFDKAIELNPDYLEAFNNRATIYYSQNDFQKAFENLVIVEELCNNKPIIFNFSGILLLFFSNFNAPFLTYRIIKQLYTLETFLSYQSLISQNHHDCAEIITLLRFFEETSLIEQNKFQIFKGVITYYMKDPSVCYKIFKELVIRNRPGDLLGQFYYVLSCDDYLKSDSEEVLENAIEQANRYLSENGNTDYLQIYYAGHIFLTRNTIDNYLKALECFSQCKEFLPSICMKAVCYDLLNDYEKRDEILTDLLLLDKHNKGLLQYLFIPTLTTQGFEEVIVKYFHIREIEGVIPLLNDFAEESEQSNSYEHIPIPKAEKVFKVDEGTSEGQNTIEQIKLWKIDVINSFSREVGEKMYHEAKDHFILWNKETDTNKLELLIGSEIPYFSSNKEMNIIDLIDYFYIQGKLIAAERYLLIFWAELCKYRDHKLSETEKKIVKYSIGYLFKITLGYFGLAYLSIPSIVLFLGEQVTKDYFTKKIIHFIDGAYIANERMIPRFYDDFKKQFTSYMKDNSK